VTSPDTVEKDSVKAATPVSPRGKQEPEALPVKARAAEKQSIFEQPKMKRSAKDFDNLKVRGRKEGMGCVYGGICFWFVFCI
jgi:hypothetical protein